MGGSEERSQSGEAAPSPPNGRRRRVSLSLFFVIAAPPIAVWALFLGVKALRQSPTPKERDPSLIEEEMNNGLIEAGTLWRRAYLGCISNDPNWETLLAEARGKGDRLRERYSELTDDDECCDHLTGTWRPGWEWLGPMGGQIVRLPKDPRLPALRRF